MKVMKLKACAFCKTAFTPQRALQRVCSPMCGLERARVKREAEQKKTKTAEAKADRAKRLEMEPLRKLLAAAQEAFNPYIRERDEDLPCISCGETNPDMTAGGQWDAGHFLSRGSHPELRFDEDNCHKQCKSCNGGGGKFKHHERTVSQNYRVNLIERIGLERVERLESTHDPIKWERDVLRQIKVVYRAKARELRRKAA